MQLDSLVGRHHLVLGASDGMGYAVASELLQSGSIVTICARTAAKLESARQRMLADTGADPDFLRSVAVDARDPMAVEKAIAHAAGGSGRIDGVFVVAGGSLDTPILENTPERVAEEYALNMFPVVNAINAAVPRMKGGGSIVCLSSASAVQPLQGLSGYNAAKAAVEQYVRTAADELGHLNIRVNAIRPGLTKNSYNAGMLADVNFMERFSKRTPLGSHGLPEDFGPMVALLLSENARWITGQIFAIDGGLTLRGFGGKIMSD